MSRSNQITPKKKPPAKRRWKAAPSKRSAISGTKKVKLPPAPVDEVLHRLRKQYPDAHCELLHASEFQLLVATVLSAQSTDVLVNRVTPGLFEKFPDAVSMAKADVAEIAALIKSVNYFPTKAKNLSALANALVAQHGGEVPRTLEELVELAGVGRKTANVVLGNAFGITSGIVVDTHVGRLSRRFGWTRAEGAVEVEKDLQKLVPQSRWIQLSHELIFHGRRVCGARLPLCSECFLADLCPRIGVEVSG